MPTYEYRSTQPDKACDRCSQVFEVQQSMKDDALKTCPDCNGPVERLISHVSISTAQSTKSMLSDKNLKQKGFTKLVNEGEGKFRKI